MRSLAANLGNVFWKDLERHHPGINSLDLTPEVATAWKQRLRTRQKTTTTATGEKTALTMDRIGYRQCLTPVRAFYLDLAQWALEDLARWGQWVAVCPVGGEEINQRKAASTTGPDVWTRVFDLRRCQPGVPATRHFSSI